MGRLLFVSPHPDDSEIGCGGLIHRRLREGAAVTVAVCTGEGSLRMVHSGDEVPFHRRQAEQAAALKELGKVEVKYLGLASASKFDATPQAAFVCAFDALFKDYDEVYLPLPSYNGDHERVWKAGLAAFRPGKLTAVALLAYEQPMQSHCEQVTGPIAGRRSYSLSSADLDAKNRALLCHTSQVTGREMTLCGPAGVSALARLRGLEAGVEYAEMVYPIRETV